VPRGTRLRVKLGEVDGISLDVRGTVVERLGAEDDAAADEDEGDDEPVAGPIAIAVDVADTSEPPAVAGEPSAP